MKLKVKTSILKDLVNKAIKASTNNKMIPLTSLISIVLDNGKLSLTASDAVNFFTVSENDIDGESFSVVVKCDLFSKIVSKTTSETISLELSENSLIFKGNGEYKIDLPLDEEGKLITFPVITINSDVTKRGTIKLSAIKSAILANKPSLAVTQEAPYLMNYLCTEDSIISADSFNICINSVKTFDEPVLISPIVFDLLSMFDSEDINYEVSDRIIVFTSPKMRLYTKTMLGLEDYPVDSIKSLGETSLPSKCTLSKKALVNILDRLSLFITDFDINGVYLTFTNEGVKITSTNSTASELIPYQESENFEPYTCLVSVETLKKQVLARTGELVRIEYGVQNAIKLVDTNTIQIVALLDDNDEEEE